MSLNIHCLLCMLRPGKTMQRRSDETHRNEHRSLQMNLAAVHEGWYVFIKALFYQCLLACVTHGSSLNVNTVSPAVVYLLIVQFTEHCESSFCVRNQVLVGCRCGGQCFEVCLSRSPESQSLETESCTQYPH